ncbi:MAG: DUF1854 domain-containing protein [Oscillospiraceae bacterium]|nr:DUF1854 domain-containing protein [Oscillospiraceae bacterium]
MSLTIENLEKENTKKMETTFTDPAACVFFKNPNGFLGLTIGDAVHKRVQLRRALPFSAPAKYVFVLDMDDKELAVLEDLAALNAENRALVDEELAMRYYYPEITQIKSVKDKNGAHYFELMIGSVKKNIAVKDLSKNLKQLENNTVIIIDVDGNRYFIRDVLKVQRKSLRALEPYLY